MRTFISLALTTIVIVGCNSLLVSAENIAPKTPADTKYEVVLKSEVKWTHLNPKRGDLAPKAATLWGDRSGSGPTGFLLKPADGFKSPPHIHNISYRGIVIEGLIHNDDPNAENMWMPSGSFWTQPKGQVHITAAKGIDTLAYIEIDEGPYLVLPKEEAFDCKERPINVDKSNIIWLNASNITWIDQTSTSTCAKKPKVAFLWGNPQDNQLYGTILKLPSGFTGTIRNQGPTFHAVVIKGQPKYQLLSKTNVKTLEPGSYFSSKEKSTHKITSESAKECIIYVRTNGKFNILVEPIMWEQN